MKDPGHGLGGARLTAGVYTDDTQMLIDVAESLVESAGFDPADMARRFVENLDPRRGYGPGTLKVLSRLARGGPWDRPAREMFGGGGSYGNGAAMRSAPIGLRYADDPATLREVADRAASITHTHAVGREGAVLMAFAVARVLGSDPAIIVPKAFAGELLGFVDPRCEELRRRLVLLADLLDRHPSPDEVGATLGNDVSAAGSVPAALYSVLAHAQSFKDAVVYAVNLGGDTDTLGAMAGAFAGALHGIEAIPAPWLDALENGPKGRDYVRSLAERLWLSTQREC